MILSVLTCESGQTNLFPNLRFVPVDVRVIDNITRRPVAGAKVRALCMGGTPYATNSYRTDTNGIARVMSYESMTAVRVTMGGYQEASFAFVPSNGIATEAVVKLERAAK